MGRRDKDLNRDFPDPMLRGHDNLQAGGREQPETLAAMAWANSTTFTASAQLHEVGCTAILPPPLAALGPRTSTRPVDPLFAQQISGDPPGQGTCGSGRSSRSFQQAHGDVAVRVWGQATACSTSV